MKELIKGSSIIFGFKVFGAVALFLTHILISRYYGAETLGVFNLILSLLMISAIFSRMGLDMYVIRILPSLKEKNEIALFLKRVFTIVFMGGVIVSILIYLINPYIDEYIFKSFDASKYLLYLSIVIIPFTFFNILPEVLRGFQDIKIYSFFRNLAQNLFLLLLLSGGFYFSYKFDPIYVLYFSILFITGVLLIVVYKFLQKRDIHLFSNGKYKKAILKYSYPMFLTSSMMFFMSYVDSFMISYYLDEYQVGIYSACIKLSFLVTFVLASVNGFIAPKISKAYACGDNKMVKKLYVDSIKLIVLVSSPIFLVLYLFPEFFLGLFGEEFKIAVVTLFIVNSAFLVNALCGSVGYMLNMTDNQHQFMKILLIGLVLNIVLNVFLIPIYGINGAAIATLISMSFWNIGSLMILKRKKII